MAAPLGMATPVYLKPVQLSLREDPFPSHMLVYESSRDPWSSLTSSDGDLTLRTTTPPEGGAVEEGIGAVVGVLVGDGVRVGVEVWVGRVGLGVWAGTSGVCVPAGVGVLVPGVAGVCDAEGSGDFVP